MKKKCNGCKIVKPLSEFHNRTASRDGKDSQCKECRSRTNKDEGTTLKIVRDNEINYRRIGMYTEEILTELGYELYNDHNPVHEQFYQRLKDKGVNLDIYPD